VRQFRSLGSARGAARKGGPYRDPDGGRCPHKHRTEEAAVECTRRLRRQAGLPPNRLPGTASPPAPGRPSRPSAGTRELRAAPPLPQPSAAVPVPAEPIPPAASRLPAADRVRPPEPARIQRQRVQRPRPRNWPGWVLAGAGASVVIALVFAAIGGPSGRNAAGTAAGTIALLAIAASCVAVPAGLYRWYRSRGAVVMPQLPLSDRSEAASPAASSCCWRCGQPYVAHKEWDRGLICPEPPAPTDTEAAPPQL
jgi:hypothetical protein